MLMSIILRSVNTGINRAQSTHLHLTLTTLATKWNFFLFFFFIWSMKKDYYVFNRPRCSTTTFVIEGLIKPFIESSFGEISSKHCILKTVRARELNFERMFTPHISCVKCVSHITCQMSQFWFVILLFLLFLYFNLFCSSNLIFFFYKFGARRLRVCHWLGHPLAKQGFVQRCW